MSSEYFDPYLCGTDCYYHHPIGRYNYTDSLRIFAKEHKAYWVLDLIGSYANVFARHDFLVLTIDVKDNKATFTAKEDTDLPLVVTQDIPFTDLDVSIQLYWENGVLLFPSDH